MAGQHNCWVMAALSGCCVLVTRPVGSARRQQALLAAAGADSVHIPALRIEPNTELLNQRLAELQDWLPRLQMLIFVSVPAVIHGADRLFGADSPVPDSVDYYAVGPATSRCLQDFGRRSKIPAGGQYHSEGLLALLPADRVAGCRILIVRGIGGSEKLMTGLRSRAADARYVEVYRRCETESCAAGLAAALGNRRVSAAIVQSVETLRILLRAAAARHGDFCRLLLCAGSQQVAEMAVDSGFQNVVCAPSAEDEAVVAALSAAWQKSQQSGSVSHSDS